MGLSMNIPDPNEGASVYVVTERLALTEDEQRLVPEGSPEARWLFAIPGQEIPFADAVRFGLVSADGQPAHHHDSLKFGTRTGRVEKKPTRGASARKR